MNNDKRDTISATCYRLGRDRLVLVGEPSQVENLHNCDHMGCGQEHVIGRAILLASEDDPQDWHRSRAMLDILASVHGVTINDSRALATNNEQHPVATGDYPPLWASVKLYTLEGGTVGVAGADDAGGVWLDLHVGRPTEAHAGGTGRHIERLEAESIAMCDRIDELDGRAEPASTDDAASDGSVASDYPDVRAFMVDLVKGAHLALDEAYWSDFEEMEPENIAASHGKLEGLVTACLIALGDESAANVSGEEIEAVAVDLAMRGEIGGTANNLRAAMSLVSDELSQLSKRAALRELSENVDEFGDVGPEFVVAIRRAADEIESGPQYAGTVLHALVNDLVGLGYELPAEQFPGNVPLLLEADVARGIRRIAALESDVRRIAAQRDDSMAQGVAAVKALVACKAGTPCGDVTLASAAYKAVVAERDRLMEAVHVTGNDNASLLSQVEGHEAPRLALHVAYEKLVDELEYMECSDSGMPYKSADQPGECVCSYCTLRRITDEMYLGEAGEKERRIAELEEQISAEGATSIKGGYRKIATCEWWFDCAGFSWVISRDDDSHVFAVLEDDRDGWLVSVGKTSGGWVCDGTREDGFNGRMTRDVAKKVEAYIAAHPVPV